MRHPYVILDPEVCRGKPCIRGTRILAENILGLVARGYAFDDIIARAYPQLTREQIADAVAYAK